MSNYQKNYFTKNPKGVFIRQKANARRRGIGWELSFEEWWDLWEKSGKWNSRGTKSMNYCMSRKLDHGPYSKENVRIITMKENSKDVYNRNFTHNSPAL